MTAPDESGAKVEAATNKKGIVQDTQIQFLEELWGRDAGGGYYVWCLIQPMTAPELKKLGRQLVAQMHAHNGSHLKAWLYYSRQDYDSRREYSKPCAIWLNATGPDYTVTIWGPVPHGHSREDCFKAYVEKDPMVGLLGDDKELIQYEYDSQESHVTFHDKFAGTFAKPLHAQAVVMQLVSQYLPGGRRPDPWTAIPGVRRVTVHFYEVGVSQPAMTVSFDRNAYERATPLFHRLWKIEPEISEAEMEAFRRLRAMVISEREYWTVADTVARQIYKLYEALWVEVSPLVRIDAHKRLAKAPPKYLRRYFFGGS